MFTLLALLCIVLGFVVGAFDVKIIFGPVEWFLAAIALNTLGAPSWLPAQLRRGDRAGG